MGYWPPISDQYYTLFSNFNKFSSNSIMDTVELYLIFVINVWIFCRVLLHIDLYICQLGDLNSKWGTPCEYKPYDMWHHNKQNKNVLFYWCRCRSSSMLHRGLYLFVVVNVGTCYVIVMMVWFFFKRLLVLLCSHCILVAGVCDNTRAYCQLLRNVLQSWHWVQFMVILIVVFCLAKVIYYPHIYEELNTVTVLELKELQFHPYVCCWWKS